MYKTVILAYIFVFVYVQFSIANLLFFTDLEIF